MATDSGGVTVDPAALNTFAQAVATTTDTLARQAQHQVPELVKAIGHSRLASALAESQAFHQRQTDAAVQFAAFIIDARDGCAALAEGANVIALNVVLTDRGNPTELLLAQAGSVNPHDFVHLVDLSGVSGQTSRGAVTAGDLAAAFEPTGAVANSAISASHVAVTSPVPEDDKPPRPGRAAPKGTGTPLQRAEQAHLQQMQKAKQQAAKSLPAMRIGDSVHPDLNPDGTPNPNLGKELLEKLLHLAGPGLTPPDPSDAPPKQ
jgi:hypothetical protein